MNSQLTKILAQVNAHALISNVVGFAAILSTKGDVIDVNESALAAGDLSLCEVIGKKFWDCSWYNYSKEISLQIKECCEEAALGRTIISPVESRSVHGKIIHGQIKLAPVTCASKKISYLIASGIDATDKYVNEAMISERDDYLSETLELLVVAKEAAGLGIYRSDLETGKIIWDQTVRKMWGVSDKTSVTKEVFLNGIHKEDLERVTKAIKKNLRSGTLHIEYRVKPLNNDPLRWISANAKLVKKEGKPAFIVGTVRDITERVRASKALLQSEQRLRLAAEATGFGTYEAIFSKRKIVWSKKLYGIFGLPLESNIKSSDIRRLIHPDDRKFYLSTVKKSFDAKGTNLYELDFRIINALGQCLWIRDSGKTFFKTVKGEKKPYKIVGTIQDITEKKKIESQRDSSHKLLSKVIQNLPFPVAIHSDFKNVIKVNPAWATLSDYGLGDMSTINDWANRVQLQLISGRSEKKHSQNFNNPLQTNGEYKFLDSEKNVRIWDFYSAPLGIDDSGQALVMSTATDITDRKASEDALRYKESEFRTLANSIPQLAWMANARGTPFWYNQRWFDYTGASPREMEDNGWKKFHDSNMLPAILKKVSRCFRNGEAWEDTFPLLAKDGSYNWFLSRAFPIKDENGSIVRWFGTSTDITAQRNINDELRQLTDRLSESHRRKDEFLATLAHELRNPLAAVHSGVEVLKSCEDKSLVLTQVTSILARQTDQLKSLVDDLLEVSRITQGKLILKKNIIAIQEVIKSAIESVQDSSNHSLHRITLNMPSENLLIDGDYHRLTQIFSNLLSNALKFTDAKGKIEITLSSDPKNLFVTVKDDGIGIPPDQLDDVFEMFLQIKSRNDYGHSGLGIGLTLVKTLVEMHGGKISVYSEGEGKGSTFKVELPNNSAQPVSVGNSSLTISEHCSLPQRKVLIVDDNKDALDLLFIRLQKLGQIVEKAEDGQVAVEKAAWFKPDIILMDLGMPKMNGYEASAYIRQKTWGRHMQIVALSGWGQETDKMRSKEAGFDVHLIKPASEDDLRKIFEAHH